MLLVSVPFRHHLDPTHSNCTEQYFSTQKYSTHNFYTSIFCTMFLMKCYRIENSTQ